MASARPPQPPKRPTRPSRSTGPSPSRASAPARRPARPPPPDDDELAAPPDEDDDGSTAVDETRPLGEPLPGTFDTHFLKRLGERIVNVVLAYPQPIVWPFGLLVVGAVLDFYVVPYHWVLGLVVGALKGAAWAEYLARTARIVHGGKLRNRPALLVLGAALLTFDAWNVFLGLVVSLGLVLVPVFDVLANVKKPSLVLKHTVVHLKLGGLTWLGSQLGLFVGSVALRLVTDLLFGELLGPLVGAVVMALLYGPVVHGWALGRAMWVDRWK